MTEGEAVASFVPLVDVYTCTIGRALPACVDRDDLRQAGLIGVLDAVRKHDPSRGATLKTYAIKRIKGEMLDEVRRADLLSKGARRKARARADAIRAAEQRAGRSLTAGERAEHGPDEMHASIVSDTDVAELVGTQMASVDTPDARLDVDTLATQLLECLESQSARVRHAAQAMEQGAFAREVAAEFGVSESMILHEMGALRRELADTVNRHNWTPA